MYGLSKFLCGILRHSKMLHAGKSISFLELSVFSDARRKFGRRSYRQWPVEHRPDLDRLPLTIEQLYGLNDVNYMPQQFVERPYITVS